MPSYTPRNPFEVVYCGIKATFPAVLRSEPETFNSATVTFNRDERKLVTIRRNLPQVEMHDDGDLVCYRKTGANSFQKITQFDKDLQTMVKHKSRNNLKIYIFLPPPAPGNGPPEPGDGPPEPRDGPPETRDGPPETRDGPPEPRDGPPEPRDGPPEPRDGPPEPVDEPSLRNAPEDRPLLRSGNSDMSDEDEDRYSASSFGANLLQRDLNREDPLDSILRNRGIRRRQNFQPFRNFMDSGSRVDHRSPVHSFVESEEAADRLRSDFVDDLPDPADTFSWKESQELPIGQEVHLEDVEDNDRHSISRFVQKVQEKPVQISEAMETDNQSHELSSSSTISELLEKGAVFKEELSDFQKSGKMSSDLLTFLCLISASEALEVIHIVAPDEVLNIQNNISPNKPAESVEKIIILSTQHDLPLIALLKKVDNSSREYFLLSVQTINSSKHFMSKLLIQEVCRKIDIVVNYSETVFRNFSDFELEEGEELTSVFPDFDSEEREKLTPISLFFCARSMLGLNPPFLLKELGCLIDNIHTRIKDFNRTSELNAEVDWWTLYQNSLNK